MATATGSSTPGREMVGAMSLRTRLVALATVAVTVVLGAGGWLLSSALRQALVADVTGAAALRSQDLATLVAQGDPPRPIPVGDADEALVQVVREGRVVAASANAADVPALQVPAPAPGRTVVADVASLPITDDEEEDAGFVVAATSVTVADGVVTVLVASSLEDVDETLAEATRLGLLALPVLVLVLGVGIWVLVGRTLAPVDAIRSEADGISGGDLHRRVPEPARADEVGRLARTLNLMLGRLEAAAARQRRFVADAAHELRTPVASIRTTLETARQSVRPVDWDELSGDVLADTLRMQQLIEQLLLLARVDVGQLREALHDVDLDDVVARTIGRTGAVEGIELDVAAVEPVRVVGDDLLLEQLVGNLVDNAIAHAHRRVAVASWQEGPVAVLAVDDDGPGIPMDQREDVFERFARLDPARTRRHAGGAGLGLAIVADLVDVHGGSVTISDGPLGGARVEVRLPVAQP